MGYWRCLNCGTLTGVPGSHPVCPEGGPPTAWERCTCGSGGHPRRCELHPEAYAAHLAELCEDCEDEP